MDINQLIQSYILVGQKIDVLWNFYVTVHLAIVGYLLSVTKINFKTPVLITLIIGYTVFSFINWRAKSIEYEMLTAFTQEISKLTTGHVFIDGVFKAIEFTDRGWINITIHILSFFFIYIVYKYKKPLK